jgi:hypothetical protein
MTDVAKLLLTAPLTNGLFPWWRSRFILWT